MDRADTALLFIDDGAMEKLSLCWVLTNLVPYHDIRLRAVAARASACAITLTDRDRFSVLEHTPGDAAAYRHAVLFSGVPLAAIRAGALFRRLWARLDELQPDVVCVNGWSFGGCHAALAWAAARRRPAVMMSDSTHADAARQWWKEAIKRRVVGLSSAGLVAGAPHADYMQALGLPQSRIFTGYDVVDNEHFRRGGEAARAGDHQGLRRRLALPERYFLAVARFEPKKNLERLIRAYAAYRQRVPDEPWSLVILGDGVLRAALERTREALGLHDLVLLPGSVPYERIPAYYGLAGAFVHASTTEQWGLVVNEAMASGLPVLISRRCGCADDLVRPGRNGLLFDPFDVDQLAAGLADLAADPERRASMGRESLKIIAHWTPETFAAGLLDAARAALGAAPPRLGAAQYVMLRMLGSQAPCR